MIDVSGYALRRGKWIEQLCELVAGGGCCALIEAITSAYASGAKGVGGGEIKSATNAIDLLPLS